MKVLDDVKSFSGRQLRIEHTSSVCRCDMVFSLYLPEKATKEKVPVVWWLSGLTCNDQNFVTKAGAQRIANELGLAVIAPDTSPRGDDVPDDPDGAWDFGLGAGFYVDATQSPYNTHYNMYSYLQKELPALVFNEFSLDSSRQSIMGHSMGGHGAITIALKNQAQFACVSAFAPIVSPINCPWGQKALSHYIGDDKNDWRRYDSCALIDDNGYDKPLLVDQGSADNFLEKELKPHLLQEVAKKHHVDLTFNLRDGYDHSYYFIATFIESHLRFHARHLK